MDISEFGITKEVAQQIIQRQIADWKVAAYNAALSYAVEKKCGGAPEALDALKKQVEQCQRHIDVLMEELKELERSCPSQSS